MTTAVAHHQREVGEDTQLVRCAQARLAPGPRRDARWVRCVTSRHLHRVTGRRPVTRFATCTPRTHRSRSTRDGRFRRTSKKNRWRSRSASAPTTNPASAPAADPTSDGPEPGHGVRGDGPTPAVRNLIREGKTTVTPYCRPVADTEWDDGQVARAAGPLGPHHDGHGRSNRCSTKKTPPGR